MSNPEKDNLNMSDLGSSLPAAAAALSEEDRARLVNDLKYKIQLLAALDGNMMETLSPKVRGRVEFLRALQRQQDELEAKFFEEKAALEAKYQSLYEPLYTKRYEIVNGIIEVEGANETVNEEGTDKRAEENGVPNFWLRALKTNEIVAQEISERDAEALRYLRDIKWCRIDDPKSFKLDFFFDTNPFFKNCVLTKTYKMIDDEDPTLEKAIGMEIEWYPGKCLTLTQKILKKRLMSKNVKPITKSENCESFFNFFKPPQVPEDEHNLDKDTAEQLQKLMEQDYDIGVTIRDKIIPHAVSWFTGKAAPDDDIEEDSDDNEEA